MSREHVLAAPVMMQLGDIQFGLNSAAYQKLVRRTCWYWAVLQRPGRASVLQYAGEVGDSMSLPGVIYPQWRGETGFVNRIRELAREHKPLLMVDGQGHVMGHWVIESVEEQQSAFAAAGIARKIEFDLRLRRFEWSGARGTANGRQRKRKHLGWPVRTGSMIERGDSRPIQRGEKAESGGVSGKLAVFGDGPMKAWDELREWRRKVRDEWKEKRASVKHDYEVFVKELRTTAAGALNVIDKDLAALANGEVAGKDLASAAGCLQRLQEGTARMIRISDQAAKLLRKGKHRTHGLERLARELSRVKMQAESAEIILRKDAESFKDKPISLEGALQSELLEVLQASGVVARDSVRRSRALLSWLQGEVAKLKKEEQTK